MTPSTFITGSSGFVGRNLLHRLPAELAQSCTCLVRSRPAAAESRDEPVPRFVVGDLLDGDYFAILDGTVDAAGNGKTSGRLEVAACVSTRCGDFEGRFTGIFVAGVRSDEIEMTGQDGGVKGMRIDGTLIEQGASPGTNVFDLTGTIRRSIN